jgi:hypothetical protein
MQKRNLAIGSAVLALLFLQCTVGPPAPASAIPQGTNTPVAQELTKLKAKVMSADYRADIDELSRLRDEAARLGNDPDLGRGGRGRFHGRWSPSVGWAARRDRCGATGATRGGRAA